jgi:hypothetical protein
MVDREVFELRLVLLVLGGHDRVRRHAAIACNIVIARRKPAVHFE